MVKVNEEKLKQLEQSLKNFGAGRITLGNIEEFIIFDALVKEKEPFGVVELGLAVIPINDLKNFKVLSYFTRQDPVKTNIIIKGLKEGKLLKAKIEYHGNRVISIQDVVVCEECEDMIEANIYGIVRRSSTGLRVFIDDPISGNSYVMSDRTIKGMNLCGAAYDGLKIIGFGVITRTQQGLDVIQYIHYNIVKEEVKEEEKKEAKEIEIKEKKESTKMDTEKIEKSIEESKIERKVENEIENISSYVNELKKDLELLTTKYRDELPPKCMKALEELINEINTNPKQIIDMCKDNNDYTGFRKCVFTLKLPEKYIDYLEELLQEKEVSEEEVI